MNKFETKYIFLKKPYQVSWGKIYADRQ